MKHNCTSQKVHALAIPHCLHLCYSGLNDTDNYDYFYKSLTISDIPSPSLSHCERDGKSMKEKNGDGSELKGDKFTYFFPATSEIREPATSRPQINYRSIVASKIYIIHYSHYFPNSTFVLQMLLIQSISVSYMMDETHILDNETNVSSPHLLAFPSILIPTKTSLNSTTNLYDSQTKYGNGDNNFPIPVFPTPTTLTTSPHLLPFPPSSSQPHPPNSAPYHCVSQYHYYERDDSYSIIRMDGIPHKQKILTTFLAFPSLLIPLNTSMSSDVERRKNLQRDQALVNAHRPHLATQSRFSDAILQSMKDQRSVSHLTLLSEQM